MKIPAFLGIALAMSASAFAQTAAPAAPTLTAGAEFKGLRFDWDPVPGASWYQLELRAHQAGAFTKQGGDLPSNATSTHFSFPLHLFDWTYARYRLAACNSAGCTRSAEVSVSDLRRDAVGYFKAALPQQSASLGNQVDLAPDGYTMVATAPGEVKTTNGVTKYGAAYVFRRDGNGKWTQRARLDANATFVAISATGNTIAAALNNEVVDNSRRGQVDVFHWGNNVYTRSRIPRPDVDTISGVQLSDSGYVLAVTGMSAGNTVTTIYKSTNSVWSKIGTVSAAEYCWNTTLTGDGKTLAAVCRQGGETGPWRDYVRVLSGSTWTTRAEIDLDYPDLDDDRSGDYHDGFAVDATGDTIAVHTGRERQGNQSGGAVSVYHRDAGTYLNVATLLSGAWNAYQDLNLYFGYSIAMSADGLTLAVGHPADVGKGLGPRAAPLLEGTSPTGAVFVYRLTDSWRLANMVKPNYINPGEAYYLEFGRMAALSGTGKTLAVGVFGEDSSAKGIDGNWADASLKGSGAIFMY